MSALEITGFVLALLVMLIGLVGAVLPGLPGPPLVFLAALGHRLYFGERGAAWWVVIVLGLIGALSLGLDFLATTYGAKRLGATWRGMVGAGMGAILGIFIFPPWGLILCPLAFAAAAEMLGGRPWREAGKAGVGAAFGVLAGTAGKVACCLTMIGLFVMQVLYHSLATGN